MDGVDAVHWQPYVVFNAEQLDGLPRRFLAADVRDDQPSPHDRVPAAEELLLASGIAEVFHGGDRACYRPLDDSIDMPRFEYFHDARSYYGTLAHELVHWTGHETRLGRLRSGRFGDESYAMEELVAEVGSAFVMARLGLPGNMREDHASYIASWLRRLREDKEAIFRAAAAARKAADYIVVAAAGDRVRRLAARRLDDRNYVVVYLSRVRVGKHDLALAVGLEEGGRRRLLGARSAGGKLPDREIAEPALLKELTDRGLRTSEPRLFVIGSGLWRQAVRDTFGRSCLLQQCRSEFVDRILAMLPNRLVSLEPTSWSRRLPGSAWNPATIDHGLNHGAEWRSFSPWGGSAAMSRGEVVAFEEFLGPRHHASRLACRSAQDSAGVRGRAGTRGAVGAGGLVGADAAPRSRRHHAKEAEGAVRRRQAAGRPGVAEEHPYDERDPAGRPRPARTDLLPR